MMMVDTIEERKKLVKEIACTSKSIRKKHRALKTSRMEEEAELEKQFKPIVEPLKQIAENIGVDEPHVTVVTPSLINESKNKRKRWSSEKNISKRINTSSASPIQTSTPLQPRELTFELSKNLLTENVFEMSRTKPSLVTSVRQTMQTSNGQEALYSLLGPLGQKYIATLLSGDKENKID
jgi:hypothetical protein